MTLTAGAGGARFATYMAGLGEVIGRAGRAAQLNEYCAGLLMPLERKSVEPIAAVTAPAQCSAKHQSLLHFVGNSPWSDEAVLAKVREQVLPAIERHGPVRAWIIDDTGLPKKGNHSVGVKRQYCGQLGKTANCQVAVSLSVASDTASLPVAYRLFLPKDWAEDSERRAKAGVPDDIIFQTKGEIALDQIKAAQAAGVTPGVVLADAGYGPSTPFRSGLTELGLTYIVGVLSNISVWPPGTAPLPPTGRGRRANIRLRRDKNHQPMSARELALSLKDAHRDAPGDARDAHGDAPGDAPGDAHWHEVTWREGSNAPLTSRFTALRVRPANGDHKRSTAREVEWLLIEWPEGETEPTKYWLSTLPDDIALKELVDLAKLRWRIERDYQDLKQEIGLGHYEGRGWRGFHHHATLAIAAYGFLILEADAISPSATANRCKVKPLRSKAPQLPEGFRPRGAAIAA